MKTTYENFWYTAKAVITKNIFSLNSPFKKKKDLESMTSMFTFRNKETFKLVKRYKLPGLSRKKQIIQRPLYLLKTLHLEF